MKLVPRFQQIILNMKWWVMDLASAPISLITSDRPYMVFRSITHPHGLIYVPIAPSLAFYASLDPAKENQLKNKNAKWVAKEMNRFQAALSAKCIYAVDTQHRALAEKWLKPA